MSTICGALCLDKSLEVDEEIIKKMLDTSKQVYDKTLIAHNSSKELLIGNALIHTTPFSSEQNIHYTIFSREFFIAYDGRLNDREELANKLEISSEKTSDAFLILSSYIKWGETFLKEIDGDFAFSIWDEHNKKLILARDRLGLKSLFYSIKKNILLWGSDIKQIVQFFSIGIRNLNQEFLLKYLIDEPYITSETAYIDVTRVEPGQCLIVNNGNIRSY